MMGISLPSTVCQNKGYSPVAKTEARQITAPGEEVVTDTLKGDTSAARALLGDS